MSKTRITNAAYLVLLAILGAVAALSQVPSNAFDVGVLAASAAVVLAHVPAFLPASVTRKMFGTGPKWLNPPEAIWPALIFAVWLLVGFVSGQMFAGALAGLFMALAAGLGFGAVQVFTKQSAAMAWRASPNPVSGVAPLSKVVSRYAYILRVLAVLISFLAALWAVSFGAGISAALIGAALLCGAGAAALVAYGVRAVYRQALGAQSTASAALTQMESTKPAPEVLLYATDRATAKHLRIKAHTQGLEAEGISTAIVAREAGSVKTLKTFGATHLWPAPFISGLDYVARPSVRAVFYTHDGLKNGHFTRFSQYAHILDATTGALALAKDVPQTLDMYDHVIAPTPEVADGWRAPLSKERAAKIVTLDLRPLTPLLEEEAVDDTSDVALCLPPVQTAYDSVASETMLGAAALLKRFESAPTEDEDGVEGVPAPLGPKLRIFVANSPKSRVTPWHKELAALNAKTGMPRVVPHFSPFENACNKAKIVIATTFDQVTALRSTGKPLLWMGAGPAPEGATPFDPTSDAPLHEMAKRSTPAPLHFTSYHALLAHADKGDKS